MKAPLYGTTLLLALLALGAFPSQDKPAMEIPLGLPRTIPGLDASPRFRALARLGERLFHDKNLSVDRSTSCATCHPAQHGFASPLPIPAGAYGRRVPRSAATLMNRALGQSFGWLGSVATLEALVLLPFDDKNEFDLPLEKALERIESDADYRPLFAAIPDGGADRATVRDALASYVRTILAGNSPVDRFHAGERDALSPTERHGMWIYESKGGCWRCHSGSNNFTDEKFHNTGVGAVDGTPVDGRFAFTKDEADRGRFKTPTLRGVALTAPYMHDGSIATLEEVVAFYRRGGGKNRNLDPALEPLSLTDEEAQSLVAFLRALSPQ